MNIKHIRDHSSLEACAQTLSQKEVIAIDLEFDKNRFRYGFNLCLMQIFDGQDCFLIDPLAEGLEIELIFPVLTSDKIEKVVFSFGEDLRLLHSLGCFPKKLFDIRNALSLLDYPPLSLTNTLQELMGIDVGKSAQMSNWFTRPLTKDQANYAASDVFHLLELKTLLVEKAEEQGILDWISQENDFLSKQSFAESEEKVVLKEKDKKGMNEYQWFLYEGLMEFREGVAKKFNKPSHQIVSAQLLRDIAINPSRIKNWSSAKGVMRSLKNPNFQNKIQRTLKQRQQEAVKQGKSKLKPAQKPLPPDEYRAFREEKNRAEHEKKTIFKPIQQDMAADIGQNAAMFILSNRVMLAISKGETEGLFPYKIELLQKYGAEYGIDEILER